MFGKRELVDTLSRDLDRARNKRDTLASSVTTLTAQIAELEVRLSAENERLERERAASKIEGIKKDVTARYLAFVPVIGGIRDATEVAASIVPEAHEVNESLGAIARSRQGNRWLVGRVGPADSGGARGQGCTGTATIAHEVS